MYLETGWYGHDGVYQLHHLGLTLLSSLGSSSKYLSLGEESLEIVSFWSQPGLVSGVVVGHALIQNYVLRPEEEKMGDDDDNITFTFPLTTSPIFYGTGSVGNTYLNRPEISAWIISNEDVNALTLPAIKADNPVIIQPLGLKVTIIR